MYFVPKVCVFDGIMRSALSVSVRVCVCVEVPYSLLFPDVHRDRRRHACSVAWCPSHAIGPVRLLSIHYGA